MDQPAAASGTIFSPGEIAAILYRRRLWIMIPLLVGLLAAIIASVMIQPVYRSSATLLVDSQQIPNNLVASPQSNYSDEQIAKIRQRILSRDNLTDVIRRDNLYPSERRRLPLEDVLHIMRTAISIDLVGSASVNDAKPASTIAFNLSFNYREPRVAQAVAGLLVAMFRKEDKRLRTEQAADTAAFLTRRADEFRGQLVALEGKRREIENHFSGALPDQIALSAQASSSLRAEVSRIDSETQGLIQQNGLLAARTQDGAARSNPAQDAVRQAMDRLRQLQAVYSDQYPDVIAARAQLAQATQAAHLAPNIGGDNMIVTTEIAASNARINTLASRRSALLGSIAAMDRLTALAPEAAYELNNLAREYDNLKTQYQDIREKQLEAQVAANLQSEDQGERFSLVDAPSRPIQPIRPNRPMMIATGAIAGLSLGLLAIIVFEVMSGVVHGENSVTQVMGAPPMGAIPTIEHQDIKAWYNPLRARRDRREAA